MPSWHALDLSLPWFLLRILFMDFIYLSFPVLNCSNYHVVSTVISSELRCTLKADFISGVNVKLCGCADKNVLLHSLYLSYITIHYSKSTTHEGHRGCWNLCYHSDSYTVLRQSLHNVGAMFICIFIICVLNDCMNVVFPQHVLILT